MGLGLASPQCGRLAWPGGAALGLEGDMSDTDELPRQRARWQRGNDGCRCSS